MKFIPLFLLATLTVGTAYATDPNEPTKRKTVTSQHYVDTQVATKQPIVGAQSGNYVVTYPNSTGGDTNHDGAGEIDKRHISTTLTTGSAPSGGDGVTVVGTDIPTVGAVNSGLSGKQAKLSSTAGRLVTYGGAAGAVGHADVYNETYTYASQTNSLVRAAQVNAAVASAFSQLLECSGWDEGHEYQEDYCLYYNVKTNIGSGTYVPQGNTAMPAN